jgi:hypothetical protein
MDKREFTVIENETKKSEQKQIAHATNPIARKFVKFHENNKFSVKDLFKK